jgi:hypothetical protein
MQATVKKKPALRKDYEKLVREEIASAPRRSVQAHTLTYADVC